MKNKVKYELQIFSSTLEKNPDIQFKNMDVGMMMIGFDENDDMLKTVIKFISVLGYNKMYAKFIPPLYDSYDKVVEVIDSDWIKEMKTVNKEEFSYWNPKHYALYLDEIGLYQFIAKSFEVEQVINYTELSKEISYALRHKPWEYELEMDAEGWVSIEQLLDALHKDKKWKEISENDLALMIEKSSKKRHEILNGKIRAYYGHSIPMKIVKETKMPPEILYHGTARRFIEAIKENGLLPQSRQYVHLSQDIETAHSVGIRHDEKPIILKIDAEQAWKDGTKFYYGNEKVWLADKILSKYITIL